MDPEFVSENSFNDSTQNSSQDSTNDVSNISLDFENEILNNKSLKTLQNQNDSEDQFLESHSSE